MTDDSKYRLSINSGVNDAMRRVYKGICQYCDCEGANHVDHIVPKSKGGDDDIRNYILACSKCNLRKSNGMISDRFLALISAIADKRKDDVVREIDKASKAYNRDWKFLRMGLTKERSFIVPFRRGGKYCASNANVMRLVTLYWRFIKAAEYAKSKNTAAAEA